MKKSLSILPLLAIIGLFLTNCESAFINDTSIDKMEVDFRSNGGATPSTVVKKETYSETVLNPCTGEDVELSGEFHTVVHTTLDANGIPHISSQAGFNKTRGVGLESGLKYKLVGTGSDCNLPLCVGDRNLSALCDPNLCPDGTVVFTGLIRQRLVSQGPEDNLIYSLFFHVTLNSNGEISVLKSYSSIDCI